MAVRSHQYHHHCSQTFHYPVIHLANIYWATTMGRHCEGIIGNQYPSRESQWLFLVPISSALPKFRVIFSLSCLILSQAHPGFPSLSAARASLTEHRGICYIFPNNAQWYCSGFWSVAVIKHCTKPNWEPGMVAHAFNPSTWEAKAGKFLSSRPAWSTEWVPGHPGLHTQRNPVSKNNNKNKKQKQNKTKQNKKSVFEIKPY